MIKKKYQKPTVNVIQLQHHAQILAGSNTKTMSGEKGEGGKEATWYELE